MNFEFSIMAHGFEKAGKLEQALKDLQIPYEIKLAKPVASKAAKRHRLTKAEVAAISLCIAKNPSWDDLTVGKQCNIGRNTVNRVRNGIHPLQRDEIGPKNQVAQLGDRR